MAEQVAIRLRRKKRPNWSPFMPPTPKSRGFRPFTASKRLSLPNPPGFIRYGSAALSLQVRRRSHSADRRFYGELVEESLQLFSLFDDPVALEKGKLQQTIDRIRDQFGFTSLQKGSSLLENSRAIARSKLTGGHSAGGLDGLTWSTVLSPLSIRPRISRSWHGQMGRLLFIRAHNCPAYKEIDRSQLMILPLAEQIQLLEQTFQQQTTISITTLEGINLLPTQVRFTPYLLLRFFSKAMATTTVSS